MYERTGKGGQDQGAFWRKMPRRGVFAVVGPPFSCVRPCLGDGAPGVGMVGQGVWKGRGIVLYDGRTGLVLGLSQTSWVRPSSAWVL